MPLLAPYRALFCLMNVFLFMINFIVFSAFLFLLFAIPFAIAGTIAAVFGTMKRNQSDCP